MTDFTDTYWLEQLDEERREHNREVDGLHERIADLERALNEAAGKWAKADSENAELRKLVLDMCQAYECGGGCVMWDECQHLDDDRCPMEERMKALGIMEGGA